MRKYWIILAACGLAGSGCQRSAPAQRDILAQDMDTAVRPGNDFFLYANGTWLRQNPVPPDQSSWGIGNLVQEELYKRIRAINESALANRDSGVITEKIGDFWESGMDSTGIERRGYSPLEEELQAIDQVHDIPSLLHVVADLHAKGAGPLMSAGVSQDSKNSDVMAYYLEQGGLGLPDRDYYFDTDARTTKIREAYGPHVARMLKLIGYDSASAARASEGIVALETDLARASRKLEDLRDPYANYHKMSLGALTGLTPSINWGEWMKDEGITHIDSVIVGQPDFFKTLETILKKTPMDTWRDYLKWNLISANAPYLNTELAQEDFNFNSKTLSGVDMMKPRWKRVLDAEEGAMGEAVGQLFVKEYFNEKAKERYSNLVEAIRSALKARIERVSWMSDSTKQKALYKLSRIRKKIGYPDKWKDFSAMAIRRQPYVLNIIASREWWHAYETGKLGKPVDRDEWDMTPQTYNAYYNPSNNEIVLPAGIFTVPGYRDEQLDDALVYGYAGASTIGHEMTHGFDDEGRQFDADGNLKPWWTKGDSVRFAERAEMMVRQFSRYVPVDAMHINGKATLGENIADLGGVLLGWDAFQQTAEYKSGQKVGGLTPEQRYFLGYALGWLEHSKKEQLARQLMTDVHAPAQFRVNGPFADVDAFYQVFNVRPTDSLYLPDSARVRIW